MLVQESIDRLAQECGLGAARSQSENGAVHEMEKVISLNGKRNYCIVSAVSVSAEKRPTELN